MLELILFMLPPLVACLAIVAIHAYLGIHVLQREIIFVDLALAQIAALGTTVGLLLGIHAEDNASVLFSFGFVFLGAAIFAMTRMRRQIIPQEAMIGIVYAIATGAAILVADQSPGGAEHIKEILTGTLLWITWPEIWKILAVYAVVAAFHWALRRKFILISENYEHAVAEQGWLVKFWDFLFYISFGVVIVLSVRVAGIMLVFSFLVVPAAISMLFSQRWRTKMLIGWCVGTIASLAGLYTSYRLDFPSGPTIVCYLGLLLILAWPLRALLRRPVHKVKTIAAPHEAEIGGA
ncbi:metal ABC transporter permease [candidate division KSB1 bacterium]|nr:MAG: metal ABC transporter permease [candidate division KSB1 bacterium]